MDDALVAELVAATDRGANCALDIHARGETAGWLAGPRVPMIERWVKEVAARAEARVDWHFAGGRAAVRFLAADDDPTCWTRVRAAMASLMPALEKAATVRANDREDEYRVVYALYDAPATMPRREPPPAELPPASLIPPVATIRRVDFGCAATGCDQHDIWRNWHEHVTWQQENMGHWQKIGECGGHPVCISLFWNVVNGRRVLFYEGTSRVVDYEMIERWAREYALNPGAETAVAMNFHNVARAIDKANERDRAGIASPPSAK